MWLQPKVRSVAFLIFPLLAAIHLAGCTRSPESAPGKPSAETPKGPNSFQMITGDDTDEERERWNTMYKTNAYVFGKEPTPFLKEHIQMLGTSGKALLMPMEEGRNAVFLAKAGFTVSGIDFSEIALQKANRLARENKVKITGINADLNHYVIEKEAYDLIVDIDFHRPRLVQQIKQGLRKGGIVVYQALTVDQMKAGKERQNVSQDYLLDHGQLKEFFKDFQILIYKETSEGENAVASLIAKKP
jgi:SAM-dependent methyltransferase